MHRFRLIALLLLVLALLVACSPTGGAQEPAATAAPSATTAAEPTIAAPAEAATDAATAECPAATDDTYRLRNPQHGYCLLYPATHKVERPNADEVDLVGGSLLNAADPRANIRVMTGAAGQTATAAADALVASLPDVELQRTFGYTLGYEPAELLDGVRGKTWAGSCWPSTTTGCTG